MEYSHRLAGTGRCAMGLAEVVVSTVHAIAREGVTPGREEMAAAQSTVDVWEKVIEQVQHDPNSLAAMQRAVVNLGVAAGVLAFQRGGVDVLDCHFKARM